MFYLDIVDQFDTINDVIIEPDGKTIRVRGLKDGKFHDYYGTYQHKEIAEMAKDRISFFIGL